MMTYPPTPKTYQTWLRVAAATEARADHYRHLADVSPERAAGWIALARSTDTIATSYRARIARHTPVCEVTA